MSNSIGTVMLSAAKNPRVAKEILRCAQHDSQGSFIKRDKVVGTRFIASALYWRSLKADAMNRVPTSIHRDTKLEQNFT